MKQRFAVGDLSVFFLSKEEYQCPLTSEIVRIGKKINELKEESKGVISIRYGKRVVTTTQGINLGKITRGELVEIVDYNPVKNTMLVIGKKKPNAEAPTHWLALQAKTEINAVICLHDKEISENISDEHAAVINTDATLNSYEGITSVLKNLKANKYITIKDHGIMTTAVNLKEAEKQIVRIMRNHYENSR